MTNFEHAEFLAYNKHMAESFQREERKLWVLVGGPTEVVGEAIAVFYDKPSKDKIEHELKVKFGDHLNFSDDDNDCLERYGFAWIDCDSELGISLSKVKYDA